MRSTRYAQLALLLLLASACAGDAKVDAAAPPAAVALERLAPTVLLPNSKVLVEGGTFASDVTHSLVLSGKSAKGELNKVFPLTPSSAQPNRAELTVDADVFAAIGMVAPGPKAYRLSIITSTAPLRSAAVISAWCSGGQSCGQRWYGGLAQL